MLSVLEANSSQEDLVVRFASRRGSTSHTRTDQSLRPSACGLSELIGCLIIRLRSEPFEACAKEADQSCEFEREVSAYMDNATQIQSLVFTMRFTDRYACSRENK